MIYSRIIHSEENVNVDDRDLFTYGFTYKVHLLVKSGTMAKTIILQMSFDDIIFENRNKQYGAYALRNGYANRMLLALGSGMSVILLGAFIFMNGDQPEKSQPLPEKEAMLVRTIELPKEQPAEPIKPKEPKSVKPVEKTATVKYTSTIKIEKDLKQEMVAVEDLNGKSIGTESQEGKVADGTVVPDPGPVATGNGNRQSEQPLSDFTAVERGPEFPGGAIALKKFLARNLSSPDNLEQGELKTVRVRFRVDKDGTVNSLEIVASGGEDFDDEVVRVCRKMPKWIPAIQNGVNVPVSYILPVTFMGSE
jgi:protein TonB